MEIIKRAAYFALCEECKVYGYMAHGHIICADGKPSSEFLTVVSGLRELTELVLEGKVANDEMKEVRRQIEESGLVHRNIKIENLMKEVIEQDLVTETLEALHRERRPALVQAAHDARSPVDTKRTLQ